jgi:FAD/FMN-containing dehydrogenase
VTASADSVPDLFWALRGGGGNFGVVTSFTYRLHPVGSVLAGVIVHPLEAFPRLLAFHRDVMGTAPDALMAHLWLLSLPTGEKVCALAAFWSGDLAEGERHLAPLRAFGTPLVDYVSVMPYTVAQSLLDSAAPYGRHNYWKSSFLRTLPDEAAAVIVEHFRRAASPYATCLIEHVHGAAARVPADATAFAVRETTLNFVAIASWEPSGDGPRHAQWARELWGAVQPWTARRTYANILAHDEGDRVAEAYGSSYRRLARVKADFDPHNLFRVNHNVIPESARDSGQAD